jgi:hypothetical protein
MNGPIPIIFSVIDGAGRIKSHGADQLFGSTRCLGEEKM